MARDDQSGVRTHEPSLREAVSELDGLRALMVEKIVSVSARMDERDRRYEERFRAMDEKTSLALTASEKAVTKAEIATEKRFDSVNEFRATLADQAANLMPRGEAQAKFGAMEEKLLAVRDEVGRAFSKGEGKSLGASALWGYLVGAIGLIATITVILSTVSR